MQLHFRISLRAPSLTDADKLRVIEIAKSMVTGPATYSKHRMEKKCTNFFFHRSP